MKKLRLLITKKCNRSCADCCNKDWDLDGLPVIHDFTEFDEIMITGGEPMLFPQDVEDVAWEIRKQNPQAQIIVYTADVSCLYPASRVLRIVDGITLTLHEQLDVRNFSRFKAYNFSVYRITDKSLRLNVFDNVVLGNTDVRGWNVKQNIKWLKNCPLPKDEVFGRIEKLL